MNGCLALWLSGWYVIAHTPAVRAQNEISYSAAVLPRREGGIIRRFLFPSFPSHADFFFFFTFSFHEKERKTLSSSLKASPPAPATKLPDGTPSALSTFKAYPHVRGHQDSGHLSPSDVVPWLILLTRDVMLCLKQFS